MYEEAYKHGEYDILDDIFGPTYGGVGVEPGDHEPSGATVAQRGIEWLRTAFPDFSPEPRHIYVDGDTAIAHLDVTATHDGEWVFGREDDQFIAKPTGTAIEFEGLRTFRFEDGLVVESHAWAEWLDIMIEIGIACEYAEHAQRTTIPTG